MSTPILLLSCEAARPLAAAVARCLGLPLVEREETWFACGEGKVTIRQNIRGGDAYVFQTCVAPADARSVYDRFVMLLHAIEAARLSGAESVTAVVPYFPGARQDKRKDRAREGISAGLFARLIQDAGANQVLTVEIHNEAIAGMFDPALCRLENVYLTHRMAAWLRRGGLCGQTVAAPDVGGLERARRYAEELSAGLVALSKTRDYSTANRVLRSTLIGDVAGRDILLVDDIVDTAGSVVAAVNELKAGGAGAITVACAHPVLSPPAWSRLRALRERADAEGWRFVVVGTSAIRHPDAPPWYREYPIEQLLAEVITKLNSRGSVTGAQESDEELRFPV